MNAADPRTVLLQMIGAFATGDTARVHEFVADTYRDHQGLRGREVHGATGFAEVVDSARSAYLTLDVDAQDVIADDDEVAARIHWHGVRLTGDVVDRETIDIVRVVNGRAVEHWGAQTWSRTTSASS